jgi:hypothetical protein
VAAPPEERSNVQTVGEVACYRNDGRIQFSGAIGK